MTFYVTSPNFHVLSVIINFLLAKNHRENILKRTIYGLISTGENSVYFLELIPFTIFQFLFHQVPITAKWTEAVWCERFMPNTSTHEIPSVIFWEPVNFPCASTIGVGDCEMNQFSWHEVLWFMNVHLECHFLCTIVQLLSAICTAVCGAALSWPGNECGSPAW